MLLTDIQEIPRIDRREHGGRLIAADVAGSGGGGAAFVVEVLEGRHGLSSGRVDMEMNVLRECKGIEGYM